MNYHYSTNPFDSDAESDVAVIANAYFTDEDEDNESICYHRFNVNDECIFCGMCKELLPESVDTDPCSHMFNSKGYCIICKKNIYGNPIRFPDECILCCYLYNHIDYIASCYVYCPMCRNKHCPCRNDMNCQNCGKSLANVVLK